MVTHLRAERTKRGISTAQLAIAVGVSSPTINRIENRKMRASPELAERIAKFFDNAVTRDQILFPADYVESELPQKKPLPQRLRKAS
jgi:transcriptional regulator with XRE-family HTH domain